MSALVGADEFLSDAERQRVKEAVRKAEALTSGEVRVHLDETIEEGVLDHAAYVFEELGMHRTAERNGVMIYVSVPSHRVAVIGDSGIHARLEQGFWQEVLDEIIVHFRQGRYADGLCAGVQRVGERLAKHFPRSSNDVNELDDDISIGRR
ncbi:MAG TPA: TPM domain-containing protein [Flavobacteriales bacterium]